MLNHLLVLFLLTSSFIVSAKTMHPLGVWSGTLGVNNVIACFNNNGFGSYYYIKDLAPIKLAAISKGTAWQEYNPRLSAQGNNITNGIWKLGEQHGNTINGTWENPASGNKTPIVLNAIDGQNNMSACGFDSYNSRLENSMKIEKSEITTLTPNQSYRKLKFAGQETIELIGTNPALARINLQLQLDQSKKTLTKYFKQRRSFLENLGFPAADRHQIEVAYWDSNFISISFFTRSLSKGTNGIEIDYRTWDVRTGSELDLWSWFGLEKHHLSPKLLNFILNKKHDTAECEEELYQLYIMRNGFKFFDDNHNANCELQLEIPFKKAMGLLTPSARKRIELIISKQNYPQ